MAIKIKGKIWKTGNGYVISIPKTLVDSGNFSVGQEVYGEIEDSKVFALAMQTARVQSGSTKVSPPLFEHPLNWSLFLGLPNASQSTSPY